MHAHTRPSHRVHHKCLMSPSPARHCVWCTVLAANCGSQVLGDFDIYVGVEGWTYESVVNGAFLSRQKLCTTNRQSTAAPGFGRNFVCDDANGVEGTFVTIVLRPMTETNLKVSPKQQIHVYCVPRMVTCRAA